MVSLNLRTLFFLAFFNLVFSECPNSWTRYDNSCYRAYDTPLIWPEAQFACEGHNAYLAVITTKQESTNMYNHIKDFHITNGLWIGLTDIRIENTWVWEDTKQNATYFDWSTGEPNNSGGEGCVEIRADRDKKWNDQSCNMKIPYICERELSTPV